MKTVSVKIDDETREILRRCTVDLTAHPFRVNMIHIRLARPLYVKVNAVLEALGGKWDRGRAAHIFKTDPSAALEEIRTGGVLVDKKKTYQEFLTPDPVADQLVELADLFPGARVLEPSAGNGQLVRACRRAPVVFSSSGGRDLIIHSVEINSDHYRALLEVSNAVYTTDFLKLQPRDAGLFDRVVMNPPFAGGQDIEHVLHAFEFIKPGGRLAAIVSPAFRFHDGKKWEAFREAHETYGTPDVGRDEGVEGASGVAGEINVPAGAFKESGTNVATVIVVWYKPLQP